MDALQVFKQQHTEAKAEFKKIEQAGPEQRLQLWAKLSPVLAAHEENEEQFVYDKVVEDVGDRDSQIKRFHEQHEQQVKEATRLIKDLDRMDDADDQFIEKVRKLHSALEQHIEMEEGDFWPRIRDVWSKDKLEEAGDKVEKAAGTPAAHSR